MELGFSAHKPVWQDTSPHAVSIQDLLDHGKPTPTTYKDLAYIQARVYRPTIGFYGNVYFTDDFGNVTQIPCKSTDKIYYFLFGELKEWISSDWRSTAS